MPPLKTILFGLLFAICSMGALWAPIFGVVGYVAHYNIGPEAQWWHAPLNGLGIRYSYTLALLTAFAIAVHWRRLGFGKSLLLGQEKLLLAFLGMVWLSVILGEQTTGRSGVVDHPSVKFTKVVIFALMLTHVITDLRKLEWLVWVMIAGALILGLQAYDIPRSSFSGGRLESVGGPDFRDANRLGGYLAAMLFLVGVTFLRTGWAGKALCVITGAFAANALVLTRSRGALLALVGGGCAALALAPKRKRGKVLLGLVAASLCVLYLTDPQFRSRSVTILSPREDRDRSAQSRIEIWAGGMRMLAHHPFGVGPGNFNQTIGRYAPAHARRSPHSIYVNCICDLGLQGAIIFCALVVNTFRTIMRIRRAAVLLPEEERARVQWLNHGLAAGLATLLTYGIAGSLLYIEGFWWFLMLPTCLARAVDNLTTEGADLALAEEAEGKRKSPRTAQSPIPSRQRSKTAGVLDGTMNR